MPVATTQNKIAPALPEDHRSFATKFTDPHFTANGDRRARVALDRLETLWFNTGTLCNLTCQDCYIESSPKNDRLTYLTRGEARVFLDEARALSLPPTGIGFTGGEPFMNPDIIGMVEDGLSAGFRVLILTNAMKPMARVEKPLLDLQGRFRGRLSIRVSLDHFEAAGHEALRGPRSWRPAIDGLLWLANNGFDLSIAGRTVWEKTEAEMRAGYAGLLFDLGVDLDAFDPSRLTLFPEMDEKAEAPEITERCWDILGVSPNDVMCSSSRMVLKRKGANTPVVVACTLLPYADDFEMGASLADAAGSVSLNHPHCARFCVLGGASCSSHK